MGLIAKIRTVLLAAKESGYPSKRLVAEMLLQTRMTSWFSIRRPGYTLTYHPTALSTALFLNPHDCLEDERLLEAYLRPGDLVVDIGANIGTYTLAAAVRVGDSGAVVSIEPHPRVFSFLVSNVQRNRVHNVRLYNLAMGDHQGLVGFSDRYEDNENTVTDIGAVIQIPMQTLDGLSIHPGRQVAALKVDVEGYELFVLRGGIETLGRTDLVLFEAWDQHFGSFNYAARELFGLLLDKGFRLFRYDVPRRCLRTIERDEAVPSCCNLLALRELDRFLDRAGFAVSQ